MVRPAEDFFAVINRRGRAGRLLFQNFCWLHGCLIAKYGSVVVIPPIPERVLYGDLEDELIEKRRVGFQKFVRRICDHPVLSISEAWKLFITETNEKVQYNKI